MPEKVAANGDYSGERYRENGERVHAFPTVSFSDSALFRVERLMNSKVENYGVLEWRRSLERIG